MVNLERQHLGERGVNRGDSPLGKSPSLYPGWEIVDSVLQRSEGIVIRGESIFNPIAAILPQLPGLVNRKQRPLESRLPAAWARLLYLCLCPYKCRTGVTE